MVDSNASSNGRLRVATVLQVGGTLAFWVQLVLVITSSIILLFAVADPGFNISFGSLFRLIPTIGAVVTLGCSVYWSWHYIRLAKQLRFSDPHQHPSRAQVTRTLERGMAINLAGLILTLVASQTIVTALLIKTLTIPGGIAITKPGLLIDSLDIFVIQACLFLIISGVVGITIAFWLLRPLHHNS
ncbi:MAG TPA: DUF3611 family protein [Microcoleaceae cyanobacterium]|jgi:hypothetical protein